MSQPLAEVLREDFLLIIKDVQRSPHLYHKNQMLEIVKEVGKLYTGKEYDPVKDLNCNENDAQLPSSPSMFTLRSTGRSISFYECAIDRKFGDLEAYPCGRVLTKPPFGTLGLTLSAKLETQDNYIHIVRIPEGFFLVNPSSISVWYPIRR